MKNGHIPETGPRPSIQFHQLCAVVRNVILRDRTIDDAEWKACSRDELARLGFAEPDGDMLEQALTAIEFAQKRTLGPRHRAAQPVTATPPPTPPPEDKRSRRPAGWNLVQALMHKDKPSPVSTSHPPAPSRPMASEAAVLDAFWTEAHASPLNRVALLRAYAEIPILRPASWDTAQVRAAADRETRLLLPSQCFACGAGAPLAWHHIVQIQHGGSNVLRNRVAICDTCHSGGRRRASS